MICQQDSKSEMKLSNVEVYPSQLITVRAISSDYQLVSLRLASFVGYIWNSLYRVREQATQLLLSAYEHLKRCCGPDVVDEDEGLMSDVGSFLERNVFPRGKEGIDKQGNALSPGSKDVRNELLYAEMRQDKTV